jgi:protein transport protein SEC31
MKLKEIPRTATFSWSPRQDLPIIATGTVAGALDASFSNTTELELFNLNLKADSGVELQSTGVVNSNARFVRLETLNVNRSKFFFFIFKLVFVFCPESKNKVNPLYNLWYRFDRLVWGVANDKQHGIVAGGFENGEIGLYDPEIVLKGGE